MALEIFLRLDGVVGGSRNYYHTGYVDVKSWQWRLADGAAASAPDELLVVKRVGIESPALLALWAQGSSVPSADLSIVPLVGKRDAQQKFVSMKLENVRVVAMEIAVNAEDSHANEQLTLRFEKLRFEFHHYADATPDSPLGTVQSVAFDWQAPAR